MKNFTLLFLIFTISYTGRSQYQTNVSFPSGVLTLDGTFSAPSNIGTYPTVIFVHGSGPNDRHQTTTLSGGNAACLYPLLLNQTLKPFEDISNQLTSCNFAVFRYDKRTLTHPNHNPTGITTNDFIADIHAAVDYAKTLPQVDTNKILLLGHSQGTNLTPIVAQNRPDIKGLISLGTPATPIDTGLAKQVQYLYHYCLNDTATGDAEFNQITSNFESILNNTWPSTTPYLGALPLFWKSWINNTDSAISNYNLLNNTPVLFLQAMEDFNVPVSEAQRLENGLTINYDMYYLDGLNHYFTPMNNNKVSNLVGDTICNWYNGILSGIENIIPSSSLKIQNHHDEYVITSLQGEYINSYQLVGITGKILQQNILQQTQLRITKSTYPKGIYLLIAEINGKAHTAKLIL